MKKKILSILICFTISLIYICTFAASVDQVGTVSTQEFVSNGEFVNMDAYLINDTNYIKLRDISAYTNFDVSYENDEIHLSKSPYKVNDYKTPNHVPEYTNSKYGSLRITDAFMDNQPIKLETFFSDDTNYIKLRDIAAIANFELYYDFPLNRVYMDTAKSYTGPNKEFTNGLVFGYTEVPQDVRDRMWNVTISDKSIVSFDDLRYLTLTFHGYDNKIHIGNMIVHKDLADEVVEIFKELYLKNFKIEKMVLPCEYSGIDELSMQDNNSSAFNDRPLNSAGGLSYHQLGMAIDLNPLYNPYIKFSNNDVQPKAGKPYLDRSLGLDEYIMPDSECVKIFKRYGWTWGGDWNSVKDYQHFEKDVR